MNPQNLKNLEKTIGYCFNDKSIIINALTHSSYANENRMSGKACECNERLEFLGDSVLSLIVAEYIFRKFKNRPEGELTKIRAQVVCSRSLSSFANEISLGSYLYLGKGEETNDGRNKPTILENAFEALVAAIYLDSGLSLDTAAKFVLPLLEKNIEQASVDQMAHDYKTSLQHFVQSSSGKDKIQYVLVGECGPDHEKIFEVEVRLNSNVVGKGSGKSKREAEQNAAKEALALFDVK